ncbi:hypothetical protein AB0L65_56845 [Nonomuraea sp. NPDC052116]|uniref:hypothetical protein n=1 Tax=Nonomuraea sp. NPDC052116 TaxID=3155665 RepID=UPI003445D2F0
MAAIKEWNGANMPLSHTSAFLDAHLERDLAEKRATRPGRPSRSATSAATAARAVGPFATGANPMSNRDRLGMIAFARRTPARPRCEIGTYPTKTNMRNKFN